MAGERQSECRGRAAIIHHEGQSEYRSDRYFRQHHLQTVRMNTRPNRAEESPAEADRIRNERQAVPGSG